MSTNPSATCPRRRNHRRRRWRRHRGAARRGGAGPRPRPRPRAGGPPPGERRTGAGRPARRRRRPPRPRRRPLRLLREPPRGRRGRAGPHVRRGLRERRRPAGLRRRPRQRPEPRQEGGIPAAVPPVAPALPGQARAGAGHRAVRHPARRSWCPATSCRTTTCSSTTSTAGEFCQPLAGANRVDLRDVAQVASNALLDDEFPSGAYSLVGPESLSGEQCAAAWQRELGREVRYVGNDTTAWRGGLCAAPPGSEAGRLGGVVRRAGQAQGVDQRHGPGRDPAAPRA